MLSTCIQYVFVFHSTCYIICDSRMVRPIRGRQLIVVEINSIMSERSLPLCYTLTTLLIVMQGHQTNKKQTKKQKQYCSTSSNMVVIIYCFIGCRNKTSTLYLNGFPDGSNLGSTV